MMVIAWLIVKSFFTIETISSFQSSPEPIMPMLHVYFDTTPIMQFSSKPRQTWVSFFSTIGGVLGLCEGISLITFIEVVWLLCQIVKRILGSGRERMQDLPVNMA